MNNEMGTPERPHMPAYGISKEAKGLLDWEFVDSRMEKSRNYWISTTRPDGKPHATPVWGIWYEGVLYFGSSRTSRRARNLSHSPELVAHLESGDETVIFEGQAREVMDSDLRRKITTVFENKYDMPPSGFEEDPDTIWFEVVPRVVFAWLETDYPNTATRWRLDT